MILTNRSCRIVFGLIIVALSIQGCKNETQDHAEKPNIILIYVDDLGYGDLSCYGAKDVSTPNVDLLARNGVRFTDAHSTAATCTPSRFSLLTGVYAFRQQAAILQGDAPPLIRPGTPTVASILREAGYTTAVVGKWHLGLGDGKINWNDSIAPGPNQIGFDYSFIIPATTDRVPTVFVENGRVPNLDPLDPIRVSYDSIIGDEPTGSDNPELLKMGADIQHSNTITNGISRIGYMTGGIAARWVDEDIADVLTNKAKAFIQSNQSKPFFLYFSIPDIHVPRAPHRRFVGSTAMGRRGDVITEMDWMTGEIMKTLEQLGISKNTLIIFSSDNGPVLDDGYQDDAEKLVGSHTPSGNFRGGKYSAYEAGTRVPTITCWPGVIDPRVSNAAVSQVDILASLTALVGKELPKENQFDSRNSLEVFLGESDTGSRYLLEESYTFSLRDEQWKYIAPLTSETPLWLKNKKIETGLADQPQLYNLGDDPGERNNLAGGHPEKLKELEKKLNEIKSENSD